MLRALVITFALVASAPQVRAGDTDSVDSVIRAVYDVISGPAGTRDWDRFRSLFIEGARLIPVRPTPDGPAPVVLTTEDYIRRARGNFEKSGFYETEISRRIEAFGNIAHVFSTYESRHAPGAKPFARGINSIQVARDGNTWKVVTILWDSERDDNPLPEKYLK